MAEFEVIPAIDLAGGRLARLQDGLRTGQGDPIETARGFVTAGARWIHVADLDAALHGNPANLHLLERIASLPVAVQAAGGLRPRGVRQALASGASRAVLGAGALGNLINVRALVAELGHRVGVGLDVRGGSVTPRGHLRPGPSLDSVLPALAEIRPAFVVYTDVDRDGVAAGADLEGLTRVAHAVGVPVLASGGVRSLEDLRSLADVGPLVVGAIVGRALHEGAFTLEEALAAVA
jgi:phosphoribosyl isomerase A